MSTQLSFPCSFRNNLWHAKDIKIIYGDSEAALGCGGRLLTQALRKWMGLALGGSSSELSLQSHALVLRCEKLYLQGTCSPKVSGWAPPGDPNQPVGTLHWGTIPRGPGGLRLAQGLPSAHPSPILPGAAGAELEGPGSRSAPLSDPTDLPLSLHLLPSMYCWGQGEGVKCPLAVACGVCS